MFKGKRVLDIGAGECVYSRLIADRFGPERIVASDLFPERMSAAARENRNPRLTFVASNCFTLPFPNGAFDVVFGSLVLHQLPPLDGVVREVARVLSDHGCYVGIEPNPYHAMHLYRYLRGDHSPNQYLLRLKHLASFETFGFTVTVRYFYSRLPGVRSRLIGTCMGIMAKRRR